MLNNRSIPEARDRSRVRGGAARRGYILSRAATPVRRHLLVLAAAILALFALSCDRNRNNPLDPQADFARERPATPTGLTLSLIHI